MKRLKFFTALTTVLLLSVMMFTLTSKGDPDFSDPKPCDEVIGEGDSRKIRIAFNEAQNPNPFRKSAYEGYIPSPDLRLGNFPGASALSSLADPTMTNNYFVSVTITSPQCDEWEWKRVFDTSNGSSNGEMDVKIPIDGYDARVQIKYYERRDSALGAPDFNIDGSSNSCGTGSSTRVLYTFDYVFLNGWGSSIPQPMTMIPTSNTALTCLDVTGKYSGMDDYNSVNEFIDINNLNPK
jgi:hypothetical protein